VGEVHQVVVSGNYAYLADRFWNGIAEIQEFGALRIMDISNPASPQLVGEYQTGGQAWSVGVVGNIAYVGAAELEMFDVSDSANATHIANYGPAGWGGVLPGDRAYVSSSGLAILDISDPTSPQRLGGYPAYGVVSGQYGYVGIPGQGVAVIDFDPPANLPRVASLDTPGSARRVVVSGTRAYVADHSAGLQVLDVGDPTKPAWLGGSMTSNPADFVAAAGNYAYVVETWYNGGGSYGTSLEIVDVSNPATPQWVGSYGTSGGARSFSVAGNHAYLGLYEYPSNRVEVIDLSAPDNPQLAAAYDTVGSVNGLAVHGQHLLVGQNGLLVLDISDPVNPKPVGTLAGSYWISHLAVSGTRAYATGSAGLQILDLSDPTHPSLLGGSTNVGSAWNGLAGSGNYVYGAAGGSGVQVVDISDPANPLLVGGNSAAVANDLVISGNHVFVAGGPEGLQVFDLALTTPPTPPVLNVTRLGSALTIAWSASATGAVLESSDQLAPGANWSTAPETQAIVGSQKMVTIQIGAGSRFFRLKLP